MARQPMNSTQPQQAQGAPQGDFLSRLPNMVSPPTMSPGQGLAGSMRMQPGTMGGGQPLPSYQAGGAIGPGGQPMRPAGVQPGAPQQPLSPDMIEMQIQDLATRNPQVMAQIKQVVDQAVMSGELTPQELNTILQLAMTVLRNPALYPQIRQFAIQQGLATEQDLSPTYDQGLVIAILIAARAAQANTGGQNMMAGGNPALAGSPPIQSLKDGGRVRGDDSKPVVIEAHTGEYVIPKHVVDMKGREFFDRMLEKYSGKKKKNNGNDDEEDDEDDYD